MLYLTLKALHIAAVVFWIGSLLMLTVVSSIDKLSPAQIKAAKRVTETGIGFTWLAGIALVLIGGWYTASWWQIKIVIVIAISAIHTIMHRRWQRIDSNVKTNAMVPAVLLVLSLVVIALAVFKQPF